MKTNQDNISPDKTRREAILGGLAVAASLLFAFNPFKSSRKESKTVKMLTQDGKLVEVDFNKIPQKEGRICTNKDKISDEQIQSWIHKKEN